MLFLPLSKLWPLTKCGPGKSPQMNNDEPYMQRCIELAKLGAGAVAPNPMVGAVLVYEDKIIGEGYHQLYGQAHAEVNCIRDAAIRYKTHGDLFDNSFSEVLQKSTIYVSLEPCAHYGKTPPCADLIIENRIPVVVIGCRDPFKQVNGKGIEKLLAAGVTVRSGIMEDACKKLNRRFFTFHTLSRPYIILKWAQSANLKIGREDKPRIYITNEFTNRLVHKWRSEEASILVGTNTALLDNPSLTNRLWSGNHPTRLVVDMNLRLPDSLNLFDGAVKTIVFNAHKQDEKGNLLYHKIKSNFPLAQQITDALFRLNIQSVLVEGGTRLLQTFIEEDLWDEARVITNEELLLTNGVPAPVLTNTIPEDSSKIFTDTIRYFSSKFKIYS